MMWYGSFVTQLV